MDPVVTEFLVALVADQQAGGVKPLRDYLARWPGHEEAIAERYLEVTAGDAGEVGGEASSDDALRLGPYRLERELGRGGQGVVYLAIEEPLEREVALKVLHTGFGAADDARLRFRREAEIASRLDHPGICPVFAVGSHGGRDTIAMRMVKGASLSSLVRRAAERAEALGRWVSPLDVEGDESARGHTALDRVLATVEKIARALHAAHESGIVHRDVKSSNVLVDETGEPVLVDFGLARDATHAGATLTASGEVFGTPAYMSPEQLDPKVRHVDRRADVYALGVVLHECVALSLPFSGPTLQAVVQKIQRGAPAPITRSPAGFTRELSVILETAMAHDPEHRYASALELAEDLERARTRRPILAKPPSPILRAWRFVQRHPAATGAATILFAAVIVVAGLVGHFRGVNQTMAGERDRAIDTMARTTDGRRAARLVEAVSGELWPVAEATVGPCDDWLDEASELLARRDEHRANLERLRQRRDAEGDYADPAEQALDRTLDELQARLDEVDGLVDSVHERRERSASLRARSIDAHAGSWSDCVAAVAASPLYSGLELAPQEGLVPLGTNAEGLQEFWHVESGERPEWDPDRGAVVHEESGLALVLIPGGTGHVGASATGGLHVDRQAWENELPVHAVELAPFLLSKFELTQAQFARAMDGRNPSLVADGHELRGETIGFPTSPVESIDWYDATEVARRLGLVLPTEAQWEIACRAGTTTPFSFGASAADGTEHANFRGEETNPFRDDSKVQGYRDWHVRHAPVGSYRANPFGLHDMHGNVMEWCLDRIGSYRLPTRAGDGLRQVTEAHENRVMRGGCFHYEPYLGRSSMRNGQPAPTRGWDLGARMARSLTD